MPSSKVQLRVNTLAMNEGHGQGKTKELLAQDLIPLAKNRHAAYLLVLII